ncbi:MAG: 50S ribosomal protein L4 [Bacillota bacterium]
MAKVAVYNVRGEVVDEMELKDDIFAAPINQSLMHQVVVMQRANRRQGTAKTKTRAEVRGGGRKPWRQKGLGRARHGTIRSPLWRGGGVVFGPRPRDFGYTMPRRARRAALKSALSARLNAGALKVVDGIELMAPRTRAIAELLSNLEVPRALIVTGGPSPVVYKSARNLPGVGTTIARDLNVLDVLAHRHLVLTRDAVRAVEEVLS